jgi:osmotically-inducible protein OsmY
MQQKTKNITLWLCVFSLLIFAFCGCSQQHKDEEIKKDLTAKAKNEKNFAGIRFVVNGGIVSLSGECPTEKARSEVVSMVRSVYAVKEVINHITIAPVVIGTDQQLKQSVDSVLKTYPGVEAIVKDSIVQLQGQAPGKEQQKLLSAIQKLQPRQLQNEVVFK